MSSWTHVMRRWVGHRGNRTVRYFSTSFRHHESSPRIPLDGNIATNLDNGAPTSNTVSPANNGSDNAPEASDQNALPITRSLKPKLPLSPLMDPAYLAAKQKHRLPKAPPSKIPTAFQQQLAKNPYGMVNQLLSILRNSC